MRHLIKFVLTGLILSLALSAPVQAADTTSVPQSNGAADDGDNQAPAWPPIWWPGGG
ncbi:hypothetical protein [Deinococcus sp. QL22]|uniref:hypothetical protein n=1 Tax=Deinococcus sp. QL22 TaxID=2939437 RepID=UPI002016FA5F|nr:hypothetical protein [Deinococcus sp. QL22]UQN09439.1 hypothetical protein M1R55_23060 [Deinococcus sp. QL22]